MLNCVCGGQVQEQRKHLLANGRPLGRRDYKDNFPSLNCARGWAAGTADTPAGERAAAGARGLQGNMAVFQSHLRGAVCRSSRYTWWLGSRCVWKGICLICMQEQRIHLLANGRPLGRGDYKDASRQLRRLLKQYGDGSLEGGLRFVARNGAAQLETIALLSVDKPVGFEV